jgi:hypothetical protein
MSISVSATSEGVEIEIDRSRVSLTTQQLKAIARFQAALKSPSLRPHTKATEALLEALQEQP